MAKSELKTKETEADVDAFIASITDEGQRTDARSLVKMMSAATKAKPKMWGPAIIGFGSRVLRYESGRELDWMLIGFSPRKSNTTLYLGMDILDQTDLVNKLGKHKTGKGCLYIKDLGDVDLKVLDTMISKSVKAKGL
jgi:hypothetical protein